MDDRGQMTVELCVVIPVAIIIAAITVNALTFFAYCAEFDRVARNAARIVVASPKHGQDLGQAAANMQALIEDDFDASNLSVEVRVSGRGSGTVECEAVLGFRPTLFGLGMRETVFGVRIPALHHTASLSVESYKPGMLF